MGDKGTFEVKPSRTDLISVALCGAFAWFNKYNIGWTMAEQFGAILVGKNISEEIEATDDWKSEGGTVTEADFYIGGTRAVISLAQSRGNQRVGMDAVSGFASGIIARQLNGMIKTDSP